MGVMRWKSAGASVRGPSHFRIGIPNQDALCIESHAWGNVMVVSDGVGSCPTSEYGSAAACRAVLQAAKCWNEMDDKIDILLKTIHKNWLSYIEPFGPDKSSATCLFSIRRNNGKIVLGMLGDGLVAILKKNGTYEELCENKNGSFSNQTNALSLNTRSSQWQTSILGQDECCAILLCTDGIADDLLPEKREGFLLNLFQNGQRFATVTISRELRKMLENWPVPKHSDDKTLAFSYKLQEAL